MLQHSDNKPSFQVFKVINVTIFEVGSLCTMYFWVLAYLGSLCAKNET